MHPLPPQVQNTLFTLSFGFAALVMATQNAFGQTISPQCGPRAAVLAALADGYGETRRAMGIAGQNHVMELFVNDTTGSWTVTVSTPQDVMCLITSGTGFDAVQSPSPAKGQPV